MFSYERVEILKRSNSGKKRSDLKKALGKYSADFGLQAMNLVLFYFAISFA